MKTQWADLMLDVGNLMDKLASMVGRLSKRETRKATKKLEPAPESRGPAGQDPISRWDRKAALRRRRLGGTAAVTEVEPTTEAEEAEG